jgi:hypothetical protein
MVLLTVAAEFLPFHIQYRHMSLQLLSERGRTLCVVPETGLLRLAFSLVRKFSHLAVRIGRNLEIIQAVVFESTYVLVLNLKLS